MKKKLLFLLFNLVQIFAGFSQVVYLNDQFNTKKNESVLPRQELLNDLLLPSEISKGNYIYIENYFSIDSNKMVLQCMRNGEQSKFFFSVVEKVDNEYKATSYFMNRFYSIGTRDFIEIDNKIHRFRVENKKGQLLFFADELLDNKIAESKNSFYIEPSNQGAMAIQFFSKNEKLFGIYNSKENGKEKINILTFSNKTLELLNKQEIIIKGGAFFQFNASKNGESLNLYTEVFEGSKNKATVYKIDSEGNFSQIGEEIILEDGLTNRVYFYKNNGKLCLLRYSVKPDESLQTSIFDVDKSFELINTTNIPVETIYKGYFEKSFKEVNTKVFQMYLFGFHEILHDEKNNTYVVEYRIRREGMIYAVCDMFVTKINSKEEVVFSTSIKRSLRSAGHGEICPKFTITDDEISFEDIELGKLFENGVYKENYSFSQFGAIKKDVEKIKVSINQATGEVSRTILD